MSQVTDKLQQFLTVAAAEIKVPNYKTKSFMNWNPDFASMPKTTLKRWFSALDKANKATKLKPGPYAKAMRKVAGLLKKQGIDVGYGSTSKLPPATKPKQPVAPASKTTSPNTQLKLSNVKIALTDKEGASYSVTMKLSDPENYKAYMKALEHLNDEGSRASTKFNKAAGAIIISTPPLKMRRVDWVKSIKASIALCIKKFNAGEPTSSDKKKQNEKTYVATEKSPAYKALLKQAEALGYNLVRKG